MTLFNVSAAVRSVALRMELLPVGLNVPALRFPLNVGLSLMSTSNGSNSSVPAAPFVEVVSTLPV